ncbi:MAG TPA: ABC transporter substrate-binding protein [Burkholderiales bacterium]|nr:ABC transporter substrate-binding protein [Burkholderiales bacterium]
MKSVRSSPVNRSISAVAAVVFAFAALVLTQIAAAQSTPLRIGVVTFLSGPGAGGMGLPARNAAELTFDALNAGEVPSPYQRKGFGGRPLELVLLDEAGAVSNVVTQYRNLVQRQGVLIVIGYISSASCLAIAPVAEELKTLTVFFDCGTPRIFEDANYRYVFRTQSHATMDSVAAAKYVRERFPQATRIAGLNQNYAWGQDSWRDFEMSMRALLPNVEVVTSQMPKLFTGQFGAEITALLSSNAQVIHSSFWGGDLEAFVLQAGPRGLFEKIPVVLPAGESGVHKLKGKIPDGTIIGARGPHSFFAPDNALNRWFKRAYEKRYGGPPSFTAYHMVQAILGAKAAYEKAQAGKDAAPSTNQIIGAFEGLSYETPSGITKMALGNGHQAIQDTAYGMTKTVDGALTVTNVTRYNAEDVNPPNGVKSEDWIRSGMKR